MSFGGFFFTGPTPAVFSALVGVVGAFGLIAVDFETALLVVGDMTGFFLVAFELVRAVVFVSVPAFPDVVTALFALCNFFGFLLTGLTGLDIDELPTAVVPESSELIAVAELEDDIVGKVNTDPLL